MAKYDTDPSDIAGTGAAIGSAIAQIGTIFQDRYARKQYDDFLAGPSKDYQAQMQQAQDLMLDEDNPDAPQQAVHIIKNATTDFMDNATRFKNNPYIMEKATRVWEGHMNFLKDEFTARFQAAKEERATAAAGRNTELQPLRRQSLEADIAKKKAEAGKAERWQPKTSEADIKNAPQFLSGDPQQLSNIQDPDARVAAARTNIISRINTPRDERQRDQINNGIKEEAKAIAMAQVSQKAARKEIRPEWTDVDGTKHGGDQWDPNDPGHVADAMAMIDPALPKEQFIMRTLQGEANVTGIDPKIADDKYGVLVDPGRATPINPVTRPLRDDEIGKVMFGGEGWANLRTEEEVVDPKTGKPVKVKRGVNVNDPVALQKALPDSYQKLNGPIRDGIDVAILELEDRVSKGEKITTETIMQVIHRTGAQVTGELIGGPKVATKDLPEGMRNNRLVMGRISKAIAEKYAYEIAVQLGIETPKEKKPKAATKKSGFTVSNDILEKYTPFGTLGGRLKQAESLIKGK